MDEEYQEISFFMGGVAKVLNAGGSAAVHTYDATAGVLKKVVEVVQNSSVLPQFSASFGAVKASEIKEVEARIRDYEIKIESLYFEIGKEGSKYPDDQNPLEIEKVQKLIAGVREYEQEIQRLKNRIKEIKEQKKTEKKIEQKKMRAKVVPFAKKPRKATVEQAKRKVEFAIDQAVKQGEFKNRSDREIFSKVAQDLLNNEMDVKVLSAGELGKIKNNAGVPILMECLNFGDPNLDVEIINSLIAIGDARAIPVFKEKASDSKFRLRIGCIRGLYKMADDQEAMPFLMEALRDENAQVRRTAITFIGWKDYGDTVPALVQSLRDEKIMVRKAAISALANLKDESSVLPLIKILADKNPEIRQKAFGAVQAISGKEITFDVNASASQLKEEVNSLRDWWQKERLSRTDVEVEKEVSKPEMAAGEIVEAETETATEEVSDPETAAGEIVEADAETATEEVSDPATAAGEVVETEPEAAAEETVKAEEETPPEEGALTASALNKMSRAELIAICQERGLELVGNQPNSGIIQVIIEGKR